MYVHYFQGRKAARTEHTRRAGVGLTTGVRVYTCIYLFTQVFTCMCTSKLVVRIVLLDYFNYLWKFPRLLSVHSKC